MIHMIGAHENSTFHLTPFAIGSWIHKRITNEMGTPQLLMHLGLGAVCKYYQTEALVRAAALQHTYWWFIALPLEAGAYKATGEFSWNELHPHLTLKS